MWLRWGIFLLGLVLFIVGYFFMYLYSKAYREHVAHYGRTHFGKRYGKSWTKADARGVIIGRSLWVIGILVIVGVLLFKFTSLADIGLPLWLGSTLGITGILVIILAPSGSAGLAKREVEIALHKEEDLQHRQDFE